MGPFPNLSRVVIRPISNTVANPGVGCWVPYRCMPTSCRWSRFRAARDKPAVVRAAGCIYLEHCPKRFPSRGYTTMARNVHQCVVGGGWQDTHCRPSDPQRYHLAFWKAGDLDMRPVRYNRWDCFLVWSGLPSRNKIQFFFDRSLLSPTPTRR